jgi:hypothetical protein
VKVQGSESCERRIFVGPFHQVLTQVARAVQKPLVSF